MNNWINTILLIILLVIFIFQDFFKKFFGGIFFNIRNHKIKDEYNILEIELAIKELSKQKIGALFAFERQNSLNDYIEKGVKIESKINKELILAIFHKNSPLHDGGIIISKNRIQSCSTFFPSTSKKMNTEYGARHRAAIALTGSVDALAIVVSETTGNISFVENGTILKISPTDIHKQLEVLSKNE